MIEGGYRGGCKNAEPPEERYGMWRVLWATGARGETEHLFSLTQDQQASFDTTPFHFRRRSEVNSPSAQHQQVRC